MTIPSRSAVGPRGTPTSRAGSAASPALGRPVHARGPGPRARRADRRLARRHGRPGVHRRVRHDLPRVRRTPEPALRGDPALRAGRLPDPAQARGPRPHRGPQDPQRPRPGPAHPADGQDPRDRRDRRRSARRRQRHRRGVLRPRLHRLHGRGRREAPGAQRRPDAAARDDGGPGRLRQRHPQGRHQRGAARLGRLGRPHGLPLRDRGRPASLPEHGRATSPAASATRRAPSASSGTACCRAASPPASAAGPTRSACSPRSSTTTWRSTGSRPVATGFETGRHAATIKAGDRGVLHGARTYVLQDDDGQTIESHSISAGLDYPGVGPQHAHLAASGRATYTPVTDAEAMEAMALLSRTEGIIPAIESAHAIAGALEVAEGLRPRRHPADQPLGPRRQGHGDRHRVVPPRRGRTRRRRGSPCHES